MCHKTRLSTLLQPLIFVTALLLVSSAAHAQVAGETDRNMSKMANYQNECAIVKNPTNKLQLFASCNNSTGGQFAARSTDGGLTWVYPDPSKTIANGVNPALGPASAGDPTLAWDTFGNLFITYIGTASTIQTLLSTDGGSTFTNLATFGPASVDQPTVTADSGQVWIIWNQGGQMVARGAAVTGLGAANINAFGTLQMIPGTNQCSFGDIAISPGGAVVQVCETLNMSGGAGPENILVNIKADGLGPNPFGAPIVATSTNVGGFKPIPAQSRRTIDAEAGLAYDRNNDPMHPSPHFGRLYLVYTDENGLGSNDTDTMVRFSDDDGAHWSNPPIRVNDDATTRSQFLPRIASNRLSGNIAVCWHDARNSATNTTMQEVCTIATPAGPSPTFMANAVISDGTSDGNGSNPPAAGLLDIQFGDYSGLTYFQGLAHPAWSDDSNSTGDNPNTTTRYDAYTDRVTGGLAAMEGDPHITTVEGVHYDFQGGGEYVSLRDYDGLEIQTRQTPIPTASAVTNPYTGLTTCVSLNTAVAARVGTHRVTFQPNLNGLPDPNGLQLRIDGNLTALPADGISLGSGGGIVPSVGGGIEIDFPNGTALIVTPNFWTSQGKWYLNVDVFHTPSLEGIMGARAPNSWLPALPNGTSVGPRPASLHQRYVDLYQNFGNAWRVTDKTSLFDYAPGTSTSSFTVKSWPSENPPCVVPANPAPKPLDSGTAQRLCRAVIDKNRNADCVFDVMLTGEPGFAKLYHLSQQIQGGSTTTTVTDDKDPTRVEEPATFIAIVALNVSRGRSLPTGFVQFKLDGITAGAPVKLDSNGRATWKSSSLKPGKHRVEARYVPSKGGVFLTSVGEQIHTVTEGRY
jgi:Bacterial Ig-like domain (group 3)